MKRILTIHQTNRKWWWELHYLEAVDPALFMNEPIKLPSDNLVKTIELSKFDKEILKLLLKTMNPNAVSSLYKVMLFICKNGKLNIYATNGSVAMIYTKYLDKNSNFEFCIPPDIRKHLIKFNFDKIELHKEFVRFGKGTKSCNCFLCEIDKMFIEAYERLINEDYNIPVNISEVMDLEPFRLATPIEAHRNETKVRVMV